jgi:hypothetical protein
MSDEEKIEQACTGHGTAWDHVFRLGIEWRDQNPSPKVLALVEALQFYTRFEDVQNTFNDATDRIECQVSYKGPSKAKQALAAWDKK